MNDLHLKVLPWVLLTGLIQAASAAEPVVSPALLDEVLIEGRGATQNELLQQLVNVENRFYERYNELNDNDDFDVNCTREAPIGTRLQGRSCRAVYQEKAERTEGQESYWWYFHTMDLGAASGGIMGRERQPARAVSPPAPAMLAILARRDEFRKTMVEVTSRNPELVRLLQERAELVKRYEAGLRRSARR